MRYLFKAPLLTCTLLFAGAQSGWSQNQSESQKTKQPADKNSSVGKDSDSHGTTTKDSRHCAANENFVKQGDHMICVPRTNNDNGVPMDKEKAP